MKDSVIARPPPLSALARLAMAEDTTLLGSFPAFWQKASSGLRWRIFNRRDVQAAQVGGHDRFFALRPRHAAPGASEKLNRQGPRRNPMGPLTITLRATMPPSGLAKKRAQFTSAGLVNRQRMLSFAFGCVASCCRRSSSNLPASLASTWIRARSATTPPSGWKAVARPAGAVSCSRGC